MGYFKTPSTYTYSVVDLCNGHDEPLQHDQHEFHLRSTLVTFTYLILWIHYRAWLGRYTKRHYITDLHTTIFIQHFGQILILQAEKKLAIC